MKPANFPGRKWQRRHRALKRLKATYAKTGLSTDIERACLKSRTSAGLDHARATRTKKDRTSRAKLLRAA